MSQESATISDPSKSTNIQIEEQTWSEKGPSAIDVLSYHEQRAGSLVIDPQEAKIEFGEEVAARLKLTQDGTKVLWPQPSDDPEDPQNWSDFRKNLHLLIITLSAIAPDFDNGVGIISVFNLSEQFHTTTGKINNVSNNWTIFLTGIGGLFAIILMRRYGRLPILFWSQLLSLGFLIGATFSPTLSVFAAMRCLSGFFGTVPQVTGLYVVTDMFPFHLQARKLNIWAMGFIVSPHVSPFAFGFLVARASWRWAYGIACMYNGIVLLLIVFFLRETLYDRTLKPALPRPSGGLRYRFDTLIGITGLRMAKYRPNWSKVLFTSLDVVWRPQIAGLLLFEGLMFGFGIGANVTNAVFLGTPPPVGFGFSKFAIAGNYATPITAVVIGELVGRYLNDWLMNRNIRRNHGVFEAESRLWACYIAMPLYVCGFLTLGATIQKHLSVGGVVMGWGIAVVSIMVNTVAVYAYCNDCFPKQKGEISALINLARSLGGFSVAYYQVPWATKHGALQTFGVESAIVIGLFLLTVPFLQLKGKYLRQRYSL